MSPYTIASNGSTSTTQSVPRFRLKKEVWINKKTLKETVSPQIVLQQMFIDCNEHNVMHERWEDVETFLEYQEFVPPIGLWETILLFLGIKRS